MDANLLKHVRILIVIDSYIRERVSGESTTQISIGKKIQASKRSMVSYFEALKNYGAPLAVDHENNWIYTQDFNLAQIIKDRLGSEIDRIAALGEFAIPVNFHLSLMTKEGMLVLMKAKDLGQQYWRKINGEIDVEILMLSTLKFLKEQNEKKILPWTAKITSSDVEERLEEIIIRREDNDDKKYIEIPWSQTTKNVFDDAVRYMARIGSYGICPDLIMLAILKDENISNTAKQLLISESLSNDSLSREIQHDLITSYDKQPSFFGLFKG